MKPKPNSIQLPGKVRGGRMDITPYLAKAGITGVLVQPVLERIQPKVAQAIEHMLTPEELGKARDEATVGLYEELEAARKQLAKAGATPSGEAPKGSAPL